MPKSKLEKAEKFYKIADEHLGLSKMKTVEEKVRAIVFETNNVLTDICQHADRIKIDFYNDIQDIVKLNKPSENRNEFGDY